jgi:hypothetical protein
LKEIRRRISAKYEGEAASKLKGVLKKLGLG